MSKSSSPPPLVFRWYLMGSPAVEEPGSHGAQLGLMVEVGGGHDGLWDACNGVNGFSAKLNGQWPHMTRIYHQKMENIVNKDILNKTYIHALK